MIYTSTSVQRDGLWYKYKMQHFSFVWPVPSHGILFKCLTVPHCINNGLKAMIYCTSLATYECQPLFDLEIGLCGSLGTEPLKLIKEG